MPPNAPAIPPEQFIFAYVVIGLTVAGLVLMVILKVVVWLQEQHAGVEYRWEPPAPREPGPSRAWIERLANDAEARYAPRRSVAMSSEDDRARIMQPPVPPAVTAPTAPLSPIATPNNEYSSGLSDSGRVQFEERARTLATLYEAGIITNLSKAICKAYGCSVQSAAKTDSTYQMALKAVNRYLPKQNAPQYRRTAEQEQAREALGLSDGSQG
jgi:hypothetical protein